MLFFFQMLDEFETWFVGYSDCRSKLALAKQARQQVNAIVSSIPGFELLKLGKYVRPIEDHWLTPQKNEGTKKAKTLKNYLHSLGKFIKFLRHPEQFPNLDHLREAMSLWNRSIQGQEARETVALRHQQQCKLPSQHSHK